MLDGTCSYELAVGARILITVSATVCTLVFPREGLLSDSDDDSDPWVTLGEGTGERWE